MDPFIGEIRQFTFNFAPRGWAQCNGQILPISANAALFSILGTTYGGNGTSNFQLPNLQSRIVSGVNPDAGWMAGNEAGAEQITLNLSEMPAHNHLLTGLNNTGTQSSPSSTAYLANDGRGGSGILRYMQGNGTPNTTMAPMMLSVVGGGQPHENRQPFLVVNFCIALEGIYPPRN